MCISEPPRYTFGTLAALMGLSEHAAARQLSISGSTEMEYRKRGVTEHVAERLAMKAGLHPFVVWPELTEARCRSVEVECALEGCDVRFVPARPQAHQRFCSVKCRRSQPRERERAKESKRRYLKGKGAEANRARRRAYYAENAEYERARERRRYQAKKAAA